MSEKRTHWKKAFNSPYLGSWDLPDYEDIELTIEKVEKKMSEGLKENSTFNTIYFKESGYKPMILNATNAKTLRNNFGTPYIEEWGGYKITIYVATGVKAFGEIHDALRIREVKPEAFKPFLKKGTPAYDKCVKHLCAGKSIEPIRDKYKFDEVELLKDVENNKKQK